MDREPLLSVIVPVYNVERYLPRCVESILAQTYPNLEIILVDDGAKDASGRICDDFAAKDPRVRVIHKENGGLSSARNAGIDAATGEYLAFVDSDDWIEPDAYGPMLRLLQNYDAKLVCAGRYDVDGATCERKIGLCPEKEERISGEEMAGRIFIWDNCDSSACDKLCHRSLFENFRYPEGQICEDVPVTYRLCLQAEWVVLWNQPIYNYFHRPDSITTSAASEKTFHFSRHTAAIHSYIRDNHPAIEPQARYQRVRSLVHNLLSLENSDAETRKRFAAVYRDSRQALREHASFIRTSPYFGKQERLTDLMLIWGIYAPVRRIYHGVKRS